MTAVKAVARTLSTTVKSVPTACAADSEGVSDVVCSLGILPGVSLSCQVSRISRHCFEAALRHCSCHSRARMRAKVRLLWQRYC